MPEWSDLLKRNPEISEEEQKRRLQIAKEIAQLFYEKDWISEVDLFGSLARGEAKKKSDIDLLVVSKEDFLLPEAEESLRDIIRQYQKTHDKKVKKTTVGVTVAIPSSLKREDEIAKNIHRDKILLEREQK